MGCTGGSLLQPRCSRLPLQPEEGQGIAGGSWDGLLPIYTATESSFASYVKRNFWKGSKRFVEQIYPEEIEEVMHRALQTPAFEEQVTLNHELMKLFVDKYCIATLVFFNSVLVVSYKEFHEVGIFENPANPYGWTPEDAWTE